MPSVDGALQAIVNRNLGSLLPSGKFASPAEVGQLRYATATEVTFPPAAAEAGAVRKRASQGLQPKAGGKPRIMSSANLRQQGETHRAQHEQDATMAMRTRSRGRK